jgi:hypothetical protein
MKIPLIAKFGASDLWSQERRPQANGFSLMAQGLRRSYISFFSVTASFGNYLDSWHNIAVTLIEKVESSPGCEEIARFARCPDEASGSTCGVAT